MRARAQSFIVRSEEEERERRRAKRGGINAEEFVSSGRCQGARIVLKRPPPILPRALVDDDDDDDDGRGGAEKGGEGGGERNYYSPEKFQDSVRFTVRTPPLPAASNEQDQYKNSETSISVRGRFVMVRQ